MQPLSVISAIGRLPNLVEVKLVDVYIGSIWEDRLRMSDLRKAFEEREQNPLLRKPNETELRWDAVICKLKCSVQKQRLEGGDRGGDMDVS